MTRLRALLVAFAASTALAVSGGGAAEAGITEPTRLDDPVDQSTSSVPNLALTGSFNADAGSRRVNVGVRRDAPDAPTATFSINVNDSRFAVRTSPDFKFNGRYLVQAVFVNEDPRSPVFGGCGDNPCTRTFSRTVFLAAPPAPPTRLGATLNNTQRVVTLTWAQPPEPDVLGWGITRSVDGGPPGQEAQVDRIAGEDPFFEDKVLPDGGGKLEYFVTTYRRGGTDGSSVTSSPTAKSITVQALPPDAPTTTAPPPGATTTTTGRFGTVVTAPPSTVAPRTNGKVTGNIGNVGDFANGLNGRPMVSSQTTLPFGTFVPTLPYGDLEGESEDLGALEDEEAQVFVDEGGENGEQRDFIFFLAASALVLVVAGHVLVILRQVRLADAAEAALEPLPAVEEDVASASPLEAETDAPPEERPPRRIPRRIR